MTNMLRTVAAAGALVLALTTASEAQYTATVRGVVQDGNGRRTPGVVVTLTHPTERIIRVAVTNLRGEYEIRGLEPGAEYRVRLTHPNFRTEHVSARAYAATRPAAEVELKPRRTAFAR
jgi:hypothetical protein